jgi:hypothetical protein
VSQRSVVSPRIGGSTFSAPVRHVKECGCLALHALAALGVPRGGLHAGVPSELLDRRDIHSGVEQIGCKQRGALLRLARSSAPETNSVGMPSK